MSTYSVKILVVDDSITMRTIVCSFLKKLGFSNLFEAEDGEIALLMLKDANLSDEPFELIVSDWFMPNMTGIELLKSIRSDEFLKNIPVLMVTAEGEAKHVEEAFKEQVTDIIIKPFSIEQVGQKVKKILSLN